MHEFKVVIELDILSENVATVMDLLKSKISPSFASIINEISVLEDGGEGIQHIEYNRIRDGHIQ